MLAVLLAATLQLSPGSMHVRLLTDGEPAAAPLLDRDSLNAELHRLDAERPTFGLPIALVSIGAGSGLLGAYLSVTGLSSLAIKALLTEVQKTAATLALGIGLGLFITGVTLAIIGTILLLKRLDALKRNHDAVEAVRKQLDSVDEAAPPPPPPSTQRLAPFVPCALVTLVTF